MSHSAASNPYAGDRTGTILGAAAGLLGGGAVLYFWTIGAIGLLGGQGGYIVGLQLEGAWRTLFLIYPLLFIAAGLGGAALAALKRDLEAVGILGLPVVAAIGYYFALVHLRAL
jgi:hypothetical protein